MEENKLNKSNKLKIIVLTALIFLVAISGITYAYFTIQVTGNETASSMRLTTANLSLVYTDVQIVSGENVTPGWTQTKTLTVYNDGNQTAYYNIIWRELLNEITNNELVISATCSSSSGSCNDISETVIPTETTEAHNISVKNNIEIPVGVTHTYTVTVLFKETGSNQNYNQNKEFYGTLNISEGSAPVASQTTISLKTDNGTLGTLDAGDEITISATRLVEGQEVTISGQDFYVVSTDANDTVLLAKHNLLVGEIVDVTSQDQNEAPLYNLNKTLSSLDSGYGLQSSTAKGYDNTSQWIGVVPFSGTNYWHDTANSDIYSKYGTYTNRANNLYDDDFSSVVPSISYSNGTYEVNENNYSIAYYVEEYVNTLGIDGAGRLLLASEAEILGCVFSGRGGNCSSAPSWFNNGQSFWIDSAKDYQMVLYVSYDGGYGFKKYTVNNSGVRPVIVVSTSDIGA